MLAVPVLQQDGVLLPADDRPAELGRAVLDDQAVFGCNPRELGALGALGCRRQDVGFVLPAGHCPPSARAQPWMTAVSWQKCTRVGSDDLIRWSDARQAAGSAAWPGGSLASAGPPYCAVVYAASPISTSTSPAAPLTRTDWWPEVCPGVAITRTPGTISASPSSSSNRAFMKPSQSNRSRDSTFARSTSARWT